MSRSRGASTASTTNFTSDLFEALCEPKVAKKLKELLVDELRHEVAELRTIIMAKDKQILDLTTKVQDLEDKADDLEQYSRRNSLRISGIPEREGEDVLQETLRVVNSTLLPPLTVEEIDRVHRVGPKLPDKTRQILIKLATYRTRRRVFTARRGIKFTQPAPGPSTTLTTHPVFVNDDLTKTRSHLLYECRKAKKNGKIKETWSIDGNILIRDNASRVSQIKNIRDLDKQAV